MVAGRPGKHSSPESPKISKEKSHDPGPWLGRSCVPDRALDAPAGLENIVAMFGDINRYIRPDGSLDAHWREDFLVVVNLPFPLRLAWDHTRTVAG